MEILKSLLVLDGKKKMGVAAIAIGAIIAIPGAGQAIIIAKIAAIGAVAIGHMISQAMVDKKKVEAKKVEAVPPLPFN